MMDSRKCNYKDQSLTPRDDVYIYDVIKTAGERDITIRVPQWLGRYRDIRQKQRDCVQAIEDMTSQKSQTNFIPALNSVGHLRFVFAMAHLKNPSLSSSSPVILPRSVYSGRPNLAKSKQNSEEYKYDCDISLELWREGSPEKSENAYLFGASQGSKVFANNRFNSRSEIYQSYEPAPGNDENMSSTLRSDISGTIGRFSCSSRTSTYQRNADYYSVPNVVPTQHTISDNIKLSPRASIDQLPNKKSARTCKCPLSKYDAEAKVGVGNPKLAFVSTAERGNSPRKVPLETFKYKENDMKAAQSLLLDPHQEKCRKPRGVDCHGLFVGKSLETVIRGAIEGIKRDCKRLLLTKNHTIRPKGEDESSEKHHLQNQHIRDEVRQLDRAKLGVRFNINDKQANHKLAWS